MPGLEDAAGRHRRVAAFAVAADRAGVEHPGLTTLRSRLLAQQHRITEIATARRGSTPILVPNPDEVAAAGANLRDLSQGAINSAVLAAQSDLDHVDRLVLAGPPAQPSSGTVPTGRRPSAGATSPPTPTDPPAEPSFHTGFAGLPLPLRNGVIYGGYAFIVLFVQVVLFVVADEARTLPLLAPLCLVVFPTFAWGASWLTIGALFRKTPDRSPRLGAAICAAPDALLCLGLVVLKLLD